MDSNDILLLYDKIVTDQELKYNGNKPKLESLIKDLSNSDLLFLLYLLASGRDIFSWLNFISVRLKIVAGDNSVFTNLISMIIQKIKGDMAQGDFIKSLIQLGQEKPELSLKIYERIVKSREEDTIHYAGFILGGAGKVKTIEVRNYILKTLNHEDYGDIDSIKIAVAKATRIILQDLPESEDKTFFFDVLSKISNVSYPEDLKAEAINLSFQLYKFNKDICYNIIFKLMTETKFEFLKSQVADKLWIFGLEDSEAEFKLIQNLSETNNQNILSKIAYYLAKNNVKDKDKTFEIFQYLTRKERIVYVSELYYTLEEMLSSDSDYYINKFIEWIRGEKDSYTLYSISRLMEHVSAKDVKIAKKLKEVQEMIKSQLKNQGVLTS